MEYETGVCSDDEAKFPTHEQLSTADAILISGSKSDAHGNDAWVLKLMQFIKGTLYYPPLSPATYSTRK